MCEVAISCDAYGKLSMIVWPPVDVPSAHSAVNVHYIDGYVRLDPYLAMREVSGSYEFNS